MTEQERRQLEWDLERNRRMLAAEAARQAREREAARQAAQKR